MAWDYTLNGTERKTAAGSVGAAGRPYRLYDVTWLSSGTGGGVYTLLSGTSLGGTTYFAGTGSSSNKWKVDSWGAGLLFPAGCFFSPTNNIIAAELNGHNEAA